MHSETAPDPPISGARAGGCPLFPLTTRLTLCLFYVLWGRKFQPKWTRDKGSCSFCGTLSQTLLLYLCKIRCTYACMCYFIFLFSNSFCLSYCCCFPRQKGRGRERICYCVEIFTYLLIEEKKLLFVIFSETCSSMVYLSNKRLKCYKWVLHCIMGQTL